ncbi:MAG: hypothetical protein HY898_23585 [Deltaproteobacteria bacterium]|nr:hypothetical protein [Deltaproteobacteria bacterium]
MRNASLGFLFLALVVPVVGCGDEVRDSTTTAGAAASSAADGGLGGAGGTAGSGGPDGGGAAGGGGSSSTGGAADASGGGAGAGGGSSGTSGAAGIGGSSGSGATVIADGDGHAYSLAVDDTDVYWWSMGNSATIYRVPKTGGAPSVFESGKPTHDVQCFAVDVTYLYWTNGVAGQLLKKPKGGGTTIVLYDNPALPPLRIAVDAQHIFYTGWQGQVVRSNLDGSGSETITNGTCGQARQIAQDSDTLYWTGDLGSVCSIPKNASPNTMISEVASGQTDPRGLALADSNLYWANNGQTYPGPNGNAIFSAPKDGNGTAALFAGGSDMTYPNWVLVDSSWLWVMFGNGTLRRLPTSGGPYWNQSTPVVQGGSASVVSAPPVQDATHIYWADTTTGEILRIAK